MPKTYSTVLGDMWDGIAYKAYGNRERAELLMHLLIEANPEHRETAVFGGGVVLTVPDAPENTPANLPPWKR